MRSCQSPFNCSHVSNTSACICSAFASSHSPAVYFTHNNIDRLCGEMASYIRTCMCLYIGQRSQAVWHELVHNTLTPLGNKSSALSNNGGISLHHSWSLSWPLILDDRLCMAPVVYMQTANTDQCSYWSWGRIITLMCALHGSGGPHPEDVCKLACMHAHIPFFSSCTI